MYFLALKRKAYRSKIMNTRQYFTVQEAQSKSRLDVFLTGALANCKDSDHCYSRSYIQKLIKSELVFVDNCVAKGNCKLNTGDIVSVEIPKPEQPDVLPEPIPLDIIYEDDYVLLVNKPKGMVVHPAPGHSSGTLVNALLYHCNGHLSGINGILRPGIVHRIDMDTTGLLIVCKNDMAHQSLAEQLKEHSITRKYRAIVHGILPQDSLHIESSIGRHPKERKKMAINVPNGKPAVTHVTVLKRFARYTYVECQLETGRTHQIRVHMASIHHPLLGDSVYGRAKEEYRLQGQTLHAMVFGFIHPKTGSYMEFEAPLPEYFQNLLTKLQ